MGASVRNCTTSVKIFLQYVLLTYNSFEESLTLFVSFTSSYRSFQSEVRQFEIALSC